MRASALKLRRPVPPKETSGVSVLSPTAVVQDQHDDNSYIIGKVLNATNHDPAQQIPLHDLVIRVVSLSQILLEKTYYPYQISLGYRIVESLLLHDGAQVTSLMARQAGKTETIGGIVAAAATILPILARRYPGSWHLNITDDRGVYRGFKHGLKVGIYAPKMEQSEITFDRVRASFETNRSKRVMQELGVRNEVNNGNTVALTNGSAITCQSASEQSKIEGATHHLLIAEEAQDISDMKMRKSLHPMVASTKGTIVKIGTASTKKCDFYTSIQNNRREQLLGGKRNHYYFPYTVCAKFNSMYAAYIEEEKRRIGVESDEFKMSYGGIWIFERGMFVTQDMLFDRRVACVGGLWSECHDVANIGVLKHHALVAGIDWGSSHDSTVVCLMAVDWLNPLEEGESTSPSGMYQYAFYPKHVVAWLEFHGDNYEVQFHEICRFLDRYSNLRKIIMDSNACGAPMFSRFAAVYEGRDIEVEPFNFQARLKSDGYKSLAGDIVTGRLTFPAGPKARTSIYYKKFVFQTLDLKKEWKNGIMSVSHPDERGAHDDYPDAVMLAAWGSSKPTMFRERETSGVNPFLT